MKQLLAIIIAIVASAIAGAKDFDECFDNTTLRLDISFIGQGHDRGVTVDSISKWNGWWGRRVNMDRLFYPNTLSVSVVDKLSGDTLYVDSKYLASALETTAEEPGRSVILIPKPKRAAKVTVTGWVSEPYGWKKWLETTTEIDPATLATKAPRPSYLTLPHLTLRKASGCKSPVSIAIVAEGYTPGDMERFLHDAYRVDSMLFTHKAFRRYADRFNVTAVMLPSAESGISRPSKDLVVNSALRAQFDSFSLDRLITIPDPVAMFDALEGIPASQVIIICNTPDYGGSGPYNEYCIASAGDYWSSEIVAHEFGHTFANLGDEYDDGYSIYYGPEMEPDEPNITTLHDFSGKWQNLIDSGEATLIEGAGYQKEGVWRGAERCIMRVLSERKFCPVCTQALERTIEFYTGD